MRTTAAGALPRGTRPSSTAGTTGGAPRGERRPRAAACLAAPLPYRVEEARAVLDAQNLDIHGKTPGIQAAGPPGRRQTDATKDSQ
ncbi:hypothetical protein ACIQM4_10855 [Streptomyces sp. NPDC091272]|uniref:hypothetical protein n=1 Tax=Streptomyces sp. NPDC091272 TaxID=3365981 RepID=UPI00382E5A83